MNDPLILRGPLEGRTLLVDCTAYVTYKVRRDHAERAFCFEFWATPGFGPPPHTHAYRELFYVLDGTYEFTLIENAETRTILGAPGTALAIEPDVPHTFRNVGDFQGRLLITHVPAALQEFFEDFDVSVERSGEEPDDLGPRTSARWEQHSHATASASSPTTKSSHDRRRRLGRDCPAPKAFDRRGTCVTYVLDHPASVRFTVERKVQGQIGRGGRSRKPSRTGRPCTRDIAAGAFALTGPRWRTNFPFTGTINRRRVLPGQYRLAAAPQRHRHSVRRVLPDRALGELRNLASTKSDQKLRAIAVSVTAPAATFTTQSTHHVEGP